MEIFLTQLSASPRLPMHFKRFLLSVGALISVAMSSYASEDAVFMMGNSLTWDTNPSQIDGAEWDVFCNKNLQYIADNPAGYCIDSSLRWDEALVESDYDYVTVQPFIGTVLSQDVAIISNWMQMQPDAIFVLHTGWGGHATHAQSYVSTGTESMLPSDAYFDALEQELGLLHPGRTIRRTLSAKVLYEIAQDIDSDVGPYTDLSDLYRDNTHMSYEDGRYLMNNLMRLALDQDYVLTPQDEASEAHQYLNQKLNALVPEPTSSLLILAGLPLLLTRISRRHSKAA